MLLDPHLVAALVVTWFSRPLEALDFGTFGRLDLGIAAWPLTILWIVGMTNAFNFMDGIDGIAGITAATAGFAMAVAAVDAAAAATAGNSSYCFYAIAALRDDGTLCS